MSKGGGYFSLYTEGWLFRKISVLSLMVLLSCESENSLRNNIAKIPVELKILRYDKDLKQATPSSYLRLRKKYPYLYPEQYTDSFWIERMKDTLQQTLVSQVVDSFQDFQKEKQAIENLIKHIKHYFPKAKTPDSLVTVISGINHNYKAIYTDSLLLLALDNYLGSDHYFYQGISNYIRQGMQRQYIIIDVAKAYASKVVPHLADRTFLSSMVHEGKKLYLLDMLIPQVSDSLKIGYSPRQWQWAKDNQSQIWRYFVENGLLFSTDKKLLSRFITPAPFSKFYLDIDRFSSPRIGQLIGWQIVRSFMENNDVSLEDLLKVKAEKVFKQSKYKPNK